LVLFGIVLRCRRSTLIRVGNDTPSPNAITSPVLSDGRNSSRLEAASEIAALRISWSRSLDSRMANSVLHCDRMVGSSSDGRWLTMLSAAPYFRPSLAIRASARLVGEIGRAHV